MNAAQSPYQALYQTFLGPVQRLLASKRKYLESLQQRHFSVKQEDEARSAAWIKSVAEEIQTIENLTACVEDLISLISEQNEHIARAGVIIHEAQRAYERLLKNHLCLQEMFEGTTATEALFMRMLTVELSKKCSKH